MASLTLPHIAIFPFMAKGHTIPLTHLAHLLHHRHLAMVTFFTTPLNAPFLRTALSGTDASIIELPFPQNVPGLPPGMESLESLTSMELAAAFTNALIHLQQHFEEAVPKLSPPVSLFIADAMLEWINDSAAKLGIPKVTCFGSSMFAHVMHDILVLYKPHAGLEGGPARTEVAIPGFPHVRFALSDLTEPINDPNGSGPVHEHDRRILKAIRESHGFIVNSFYEMESAYFDYWDGHLGPKSWPIGPLCLARPPAEPDKRLPWNQWLDEKLSAGRTVLYIAFGTLAVVSEVQMQKIAAGLERAEVDFLWVVRAEGVNLGPGFEERVKERGKVMREWVDQYEILRHECVKGFLSHCGWNSVLESISAGVPLVVWPMCAEQPVNVKFVVNELRVAIRVHTSDGSLGGLVGCEEVEKAVRELMFGEEGKETAKNVAQLAAKAKTAVTEGGSSWIALERMINELCRKEIGTTES